MDKVNLKNLLPKERIDFFQSKYEYYKLFNRRMITVATVACMFFFVSDCGLFGRFAYETFLPRMILIVPFVLYIILSKKTKDYRIMVPVTYLMIHIIIWCTDWATYLLPDRQFAIPGMMIMNLIFICAGFAAPYSYSLIGHLLLIADIVVADMFIHYANIEMMYMFNVSSIIAVCAMHHMMQNVYFEHYITRNKLKNMVVHDQLTGVFNRNILKELIDDNTGVLHFEEKKNVSLLLTDIDLFKKVNDLYGHEAGDKVIAQLANILKSTVRTTDYVIRWGGEEFLVIMPDCPADRAVRTAEELRKTVESVDNGVCKTTISIGVAMYDGGNYHDTIRKADEAMYKAKASGRNKVVLYE